CAHPTRRGYLLVLRASASTAVYPLSLHDALPIFCRMSMPSYSTSQRMLKAAKSCACSAMAGSAAFMASCFNGFNADDASINWEADRKSTRLNSSHLGISYDAFCCKKKKSNLVEFV